MGNSASEIVSRVSGLRIDELEKQLKQDLELLQDPGTVFNSSKLASRTDLANYNVPASIPKSHKYEKVPTDEEQSYLCSQDFLDNARDRQESVIKNLMTDITKSVEVDISSVEISKRLQAFCRVFEAILRVNEFKAKTSKEEKKNKGAKGSLPSSARAAIKFGLSTLINLIECVAALNPQLYELVLGDANQILSETPPLSMQTSDLTLVQSFEELSAFFDSVISGKISTLTREVALQTFLPFVKLAIATGSLNSFLLISIRLLQLNDKTFIPSLFPALQTLYKIPPTLNLFYWNPDAKNSTLDLQLDSVLPSIDNTVGNVFLSQVFTSEKFYLEIVVNKLTPETVFGVCDEKFTNLTAAVDSSVFCATYWADSSFKIKADSPAKYEPWVVNDKIGIFLDMDAKKLSFYRNGVKQTTEPVAIPIDRVKVYVSISKEASVTFNRAFEYPSDIKNIFVEEQSFAVEIEKTLQNEVVPEEFAEVTSGEVSALILTKLASSVLPIEYLILSKKFKFAGPCPAFGIEAHKKTIELLHLIQQKLNNLLATNDFSIISESSLKNSISAVLSLLKIHLLMNDQIDADLSQDLKMSILQETVNFIKSVPTGKQSELATLLVSSCFEIFYKDPSEKLKYIVEALERGNSSDILPVFKEMESKIFAEIARPDKVFPALSNDQEEHIATVKKFYKLLIDNGSEITNKVFKGESVDTSLITLLESTQTAIFAQAGNAGFKGKWPDIIQDYSSYFLQKCNEILSSNPHLYEGELNPDLLARINCTILSQILDKLLNSLVLTPLELSLISGLLPLVNEIANHFSKVFTPPCVLSLGIGVVEDCYESSHNYADNSQLTHLIKTPNAIKYILEFDPQCKTENGCDYLELWLDETASNKHSRWEGENFPKEPVEVVNPLLYFTFRSDGSVNYWGWKISIKAYVESSYYKKQWPETSKDTLEVFFGLSSCKLITSKFDVTEIAEDTLKVLQNPLLKFGIFDRCLTSVKPLVPINQDLLKIIDHTSKQETSFISEALLPVSILPDYDIGLQQYLENYSKISENRYSESEFLHKLIEGDSELLGAWNALKKKAGLIGGVTSIGGNELDQAERAVFAVYTTFFEIVDTMSKIFSSTNEAGSTVKLFVKESCNIRTWAQKQKQKLMDGGNAEITYTVINNDIVKKCAILIGCDYKSSLKELGISKVMKNITANIAKIQDKKSLKIGSKWKAVQEAMKSVHKLKALTSIRKKSSKAENEDIKEFTRVSEFVKNFLESPVPIEKIAEALESRRAKAIARAVGFLSISKQLNYSTTKHETVIVKAFSDSLKKDESKLYYSNELQGIDPELMASVQKAFFTVFRSLQQDIIGFAYEEFSFETYSHFNTVIEALSCQLKAADIHMLLDQPLTATAKVLLRWAKGCLREKPLERKFIHEKCIKRFALLTEDAIAEGTPKILIEKREESPSLFLTYEFSELELPITEFIVSTEERQDLELAVPEFTQNEVKKWIYIKRSEPSPDFSYLTEVSAEFAPKYEKYAELLTPINKAEREKLDKLKFTLCSNSWSLYKQLLFAVVGVWGTSNVTQQLLVQDLFLKVVFDEVNLEIPSLALDDLNLKALSTGESWLSKNLVLETKKISKMERWLNEFYKDNQSELAEIIQGYVQSVDGLCNGKVPDLDNEKAKSVLKDCKNEEGEYDFFRFLETIKNLPNLSEKISSYIQNSPLWNNWDKEFQRNDPNDTQKFIQEVFSGFEAAPENSFSVYIELLKGTNGIVPKEKLPEGTPEEFKLENGSFDVYKALTSIKSNEAFANYAKEFKSFYATHPEFLASFSEIDKINKATRDYVASLLWTLYGGFTSQCLGHALSKDKYILPLLDLAFNSGSILLSTLASRLLGRILASEHSPQSFSHLWEKVKTEDSNIVRLLLTKIGKSAFFNESKRIGYESKVLLLSLLKAERWKEFVINELMTVLEKTADLLQNNDVIEAIHSGAILFVAVNDGCNVSPFVLATVTLKETAFARGIVKEEIDSKTFMVYSVIDDTTAKVDFANIESIEAPGVGDLYQYLAEHITRLSSVLSHIFEGLSSSFSRPLPVKAELTTLLPTFYQYLESVVLSTVSDLSLKFEIDSTILEKIVSPLLGTHNKTQPISKVLYNKILKEISNKLDALKVVPDEPKPQEIQEKINAASDEQKEIITNLQNLGFSPHLSYQFALKGVKDLEAIKNFAEDEPSTQIYKLGPFEDSQLIIEDEGGVAEIYQNNLYQLVIADNSKSVKKVSFAVPSSIFKALKYFTNEITIRIAIEGTSHEGLVHYEFSLGDLKFSVKNEGFLHNDSEKSSLSLDTALILQIHAKVNGEITIHIENNSVTFESFSRKLFNGVKVADFSFELHEGSCLQLLLLEIHDGHAIFKTPSKIEKTKKSETNDRFAKIKIKSQSIDKLRLKLLGIDQDQIDEISKTHTDLHSSISYSFDNYLPSINSENLAVTSQGITDLKIFETIDQVPSDYSVVKVFENFKEIDLVIPNRKILAYKKEVLKSDTKALVNFSVSDATGGESIGDLTVGTEDRSNTVHSTLGLQSAKEQAIREIVFIKSSSIYNVGVPLNFTIVSDKEGKAINIAPKNEKSFYLFVAVLKVTTLLDVPVVLLENTISKGTNFGLIDTPKQTHNKKEEETDYSGFSLIELFALIQDYESFRRSSISKAFLKNLFKKYPSLVLSLSSTHSISKLLKYVDSDILKSLSSLLSNSEFRENLISECFVLLLSTLISKSGGGRTLKSVWVESTHPYDNNMDVDDVITIPGAKGLRIEFDPQCYTESGCDPLRFYSGPGRSGELKCLSGQGEANWQAFDVPGDTVYTYFHSDGSVNYWGYKFEVIPVGGASGENVNFDLALSLLSEIVKDPNASEFVTSEKFLVPLYVFLLGTPSIDDKVRVLNIFKEIFICQNNEYHKAVLKALAESAGKLYESTKAEKVAHPVLQSIIQLLCEAKTHGNIGVKDAWFLDLADLLSDMNGLAFKGQNFELFLFENYKGEATSKLELNFESEHPYLLTTKSKAIEIPGAHSLSIEFSPESKAEKRHCAYFSSDSEGLHNVEAQETAALINAKWDLKGPSVVVDQDDKRVTRTDSSGWGNSFVSHKFTTGVSSVSFFIENDGGSNYLYLGLIESDDNNTYDMASHIGSDYSKRVWTWKKSGEMHMRGFNSAVEGFGTGDVVKFVVNMQVKTITTFKNNKEMFVFNDIANSVVPAISFGGSNQFVVLKQIETLSTSSLESKQVKVMGDTAYLWFPVNVGFHDNFSWDYATNERGKVSENKLGIEVLGENPSIFPTNVLLTSGKHFFSVKINKAGKAFVGVSNLVAITQNNFSEENNLWVNSEGSQGDNPIEGFGEGDVIGVCLEIEENLVMFFKNSKLLHRVEGKLVKNDSYKFVVASSHPGQEILIVKQKPSEIDLFKIDSEGPSTEWGYKIKVVPDFKGRSLGSVQIFLGSSTKEFQEGWETYNSKFSSIFSTSAAEELISYLDQFCASKSKNPISLEKADIAPTKAELIYYPDLEKLEEQKIFELYKILQNFNRRISGMLYLFDLNLTNVLTEMQKNLIGCRNYMFFNIKNELFQKLLEKTKNDLRTEITVDRPKASRHRLRKEVDLEGQFSNFGQIYRAMSAVDNKGFRNFERIYKINYRGEASIDAGGPYNESMSNICDELQSSYLRLLVPSQNNQHNMGEHRDAWVINPAATSEIDLDLYGFLGKIMGAAIRTQNNLNLALPPLFWKKILREPVTVKDLRGVDVCTVQILEILQKPLAHELTPENFEYAYDETFTTRDSSGREIELIEKGKELKVTFENCGEYAELILKARLNENPSAYNRIREGISAVVPFDYLNLMSYKQLETLVCGVANVDVDILKENTDYDGCGPSDQHIVFFWEVLKEFSPKERSLYLKFVWGRSRLPSGKDWKHMKITRLNPSGPVNNHMPVSHTCFFTLDLPAYTNKDALKQKLLYAITHCTDIDLDGTAGAGWEDHD